MQPLTLNLISSEPNFCFGWRPFSSLSSSQYAEPTRSIGNSGGGGNVARLRTGFCSKIIQEVDWDVEGCAQRTASKAKEEDTEQRVLERSLHLARSHAIDLKKPLAPFPNKVSGLKGHELAPQPRPFRNVYLRSLLAVERGQRQQAVAGY